MKEIKTYIKISASAQTVWEIISNLTHYSEWNPILYRAEGKIELGAALKLNFHPPGLNKSLCHATVTSVIPGQELRWIGHYLSPHLFQGEHCFIIKSRGAHRVLLIQNEYLNGILVPFANYWLNNNIKRGFEIMNLAIKSQAEKSGHFKSSPSLDVLKVR